MNDGEHVGETARASATTCSVNDGKGGSRRRDATPGGRAADNPARRQPVRLPATYDSDGDADFLIGSLSGPDTVLINDGHGHLQAGQRLL